MKSIKVLLSLLLVFVSAAAFASEQTPGTAIKSLYAGQNIKGGEGPFLMLFPQGSTSPPSCATLSTAYYVIDPTTPYGQAAIQLALMALTTGRNVTAWGAGTCNIYPGYEDLAYFYTTD